MIQKSQRKLDLNQPCGVHVERLNRGEPILSPTSNWWETGVTFNAAAFYLKNSPENVQIIHTLLPMLRPDDPQLDNGVVTVYYRARPETDPGAPFTRSFIGLALFTPELKLIYRFQEPVIFPSADPAGFDAYGVEDPRIHRFGDAFYMIYCGVRADQGQAWKANLCLATSKDMLHWEKLGIMPGNITQHNNKDGVFFPDIIHGKYYLLHRPFAEGWLPEVFTIHLAESNSLSGPWSDLGEVLRAFENPHMRVSWVGAGSVPILVTGEQYIEIFHTGNYLNEDDREYDLDAALFDFACYDPARPTSIVTARLQSLMVPETPAELHSHSQLQVGNVLFACGSYEYQDWIYIIYSGADTYTLAARVHRKVLLEAFEDSCINNPFL
jgi:predicted GH43/DUF377 family glycosyl hydrolase